MGETPELTAEELTDAEWCEYVGRTGPFGCKAVAVEAVLWRLKTKRRKAFEEAAEMRLGNVPAAMANQRYQDVWGKGWAAGIRTYRDAIRALAKEQDPRAKPT